MSLWLLIPLIYFAGFAITFVFYGLRGVGNRDSKRWTSDAPPTIIVAPFWPLTFPVCFVIWFFHRLCDIDDWLASPSFFNPFKKGSSGIFL